MFCATCVQGESVLYQRTAKSGLQYVGALDQMLQSDVSFGQGMQHAGDFSLCLCSRARR